MRRVVFYLFFDPAGQVDDYVIYKLEKLRQHVDHIFVVSNSVIQPEGRQRLQAVADTVWERENKGFDVWAYKTAMERFGRERLAEYDELILMNYTFFGPIHPFDKLFAQSETWDVDFWGVTEHGEVRPHPTLPKPMMPAHIQSHWIAVRKSMFTSQDFQEYWDTMPMITSYHDSINVHESKFTEHFSKRGFKYEVAYPRNNYPNMHPIFDNAALLVSQGCPMVKRRVFFHDPVYLDKEAIIGRDVIREVEKAGYPVDLMWQNLARTTEPRILATNAGFDEVLPDYPDVNNIGQASLDAAKELKVAVMAHIFYPEMTAEILGLSANLPAGYDLYITTDNEEKKATISEFLGSAAGVAMAGQLQNWQVRVLPSNRGRATSAFFIGMHDVLTSDAYDVVFKMHSKLSPQDGYNAGTLFKRHVFDNLLGDPGYTANLLGLFAKYPSLGMIFPPVVHIGYATMGHSWFRNIEPAKQLAERVGIKVPFDRNTPLSPYGDMYAVRPKALRKLLEAGFDWDDFPDNKQWGDGSLAHVLERMVSYAVLSEGYHVRTAMNTYWAGINYVALEYKYQAVTAYLPASVQDQVPYLASGRVGDIMAIRKRNFVVKHPKLYKLLRNPYRLARVGYRLARKTAGKAIRLIKR